MMGNNCIAADACGSDDEPGLTSFGAFLNAFLSIPET